MADSLRPLLAEKDEWRVERFVTGRFRFTLKHPLWFAELFYLPGW
jgi:hypothetical protein